MKRFVGMIESVIIFCFVTPVAIYTAVSTSKSWRKYINIGLVQLLSGKPLKGLFNILRIPVGLVILLLMVAGLIVVTNMLEEGK